MKVTNKALRCIVVLVLFGLINVKVFSQHRIDSSNLVKFLQRNADSSIMFYNRIVLLKSYPNYLIISKKGDSLTLYTYAHPGNSKHYDSIYNTVEIDANQYFHTKILSSENRLKFWNDIMRLKPWQLKDDRDTTYWDSGRFLVFDGYYLSLLLITKNNIRHLYYSNPDIYEEHRPGNVTRQKILKIEKTFQEVFN